MQNHLFTLTLFFCVCITHLSAENCSNKCVNVLTTVKCHKICITTNGIINTDNNNGGKNDKTDNGDKNNENKKDKDGDDDDIDIDDNNGKNNTNNNNNNNNLDLGNGTNKNSTFNNNSNNTNNSISESREILDVAIDGLENVFNWFQISSNSTDGIIARCIGAAKGLKVAMPIILFKLGVIVTIVSFLTIFSLKTLGMLGTLLFFNFGGAFSRILPSTSGQLVESPHPQNIHYHFHNRRLQYLNSRNERYFPEMTENSGVYNNNQMVEQNNNEVFNNEPVNYDETDINHMISWDKWNNLVPVPVPVPEDGYENNYRNINDYYN